MTMPRPNVTTVRPYIWKNKDQQIPGIILTSDQKIRAHLTPAEALQVANDIADTLGELNNAQQS